MSSPIVTLTSSSSTNIVPYRNTRILRDPPFSSYLNGAEETFVLKLRGMTAHGFSTSVSVPPEDAEIDVFDAEKYFNQNYDSLPAASRIKRDNLAEIFVVKEQPRIATPSIRSESTWNSQSTLLHNVLRKQQIRRTRKNNFLASIGCSCSCRDKNSINIHNVNSRSEQQDKTRGEEEKVRVHTDIHFSFPVFNPKNENQAVFGPSVIETGKYGFNPSGKLLNFNSLAAGTGQEGIVVSSTSMEDSDSDASSDLFEIESLSSCVTPRAGYAPSEASIEWSVVTASAADFSVLSDSEDLKSNSARPQKVASFKERSKRRSGSLSGCRNHKAVDVAGPHKIVDKDNIDLRNKHCVVSKPHHGSAPHLVYT